jgi:phospholipase C
MSLATIAMLQFSVAGPLAGTAQAHDDEKGKARTPIKHVIVIVGENRTFDHIFATYVPKRGHVDNLLSKKIIKEDGTPDTQHNWSKAEQFSADVPAAGDFELAPKKKDPYSVLPAPLNGGPTDVCKDNGICTPADATSSEAGLSNGPADPNCRVECTVNYYDFLQTGGTGLTGHVPDSRIDGVHASAPYSTLKPGPFQLTGKNFPYDSYAASPVHRFYQMFQQLDCDAKYATKHNPSGCLSDLFTWTEVTVGSNNNGKSQPVPFFPGDSPNTVPTYEGATAMGFYNMQAGDAPYTKYLADNYAISDNYHQPAKGGTGLDSIYLFFADALWFSKPDGTPDIPPHNEKVWAGGPVDEIENPNSQTGKKNFWIQDGYGGFCPPPSLQCPPGVPAGVPQGAMGVYGGGSYTNCSDPSQPGVKPIRDYLASLPRPIEPNCDPGHYYLLNNYNPGVFPDGTNAFTDTNPKNTPFTIPPTNQRSIGDVLLENNVSWKGYNDQWDAYLTDKYQLNYGTVGPNSDQYCNICNGFNYQTQIMTNPTLVSEHLKDVTDLYTDIKNGTLPAVSFVKPSGWVDGHPASSKWNLFEGFVKKIVEGVQANPELWKSTAIFVTVDEGGGYYDSGYVDALDFFGDGTRIPLLVVSPYAKKGRVSHSYADHASILKFIERNWNLPTISGRSRDNMPNPIQTNSKNWYAPVNSPAISDLFDMFKFEREGEDDD